MEGDALRDMAYNSKFVLATGGGTPMQHKNCPTLAAQGIVIYLTATPDALCRRFKDKGVPAYLENDSSLDHLTRIYEQRDKVYRKLANYTIDTSLLKVEEVVSQIILCIGSKSTK